MTRIQALHKLKEGKKVRRQSWDENEILIFKPAGGDWMNHITPSYGFVMNKINRIGKSEISDWHYMFVRIYTDFLQDDWEIVE